LALYEATLRDFFRRTASGRQLAAEAATATEQTGAKTFRVHVVKLEGNDEFIVDRSMLVDLCDAVLAGDVPPACLEPIGFALVFSEHLRWAEEDDLVPDILYDWASPEINWELTTENVRMFRGWLTGEHEPPPRPQLDTTSSGAPLVRRTELAPKPSGGANRGDDA